MIVIDKHNHKRIRDIKTFTKNTKDKKLKLMFFLSPADVKNTAFLTFDYDKPDLDDDQWLYLPELKKIKRIASSDKSSSFMGSDFTYSDMTERNVEDYTYKVMRERKVNGHLTWQIMVKPKNKKVIDETDYKKSIIFVRKDNFVIVQALHYLKNNGKLKYMKVNKLEKINDIWSVKSIQMITKKGKKILHKTIFEFSDVKYNKGLDDKYFNTRTLKKGI